MKNYLLTKLHNGYAAARACPPMRNLFTVPRKAALKDLSVKYPLSSSRKGGMATSLKKASSVNNSATASSDDKLSITIIKGTKLAAKDSNGLSDPYIIVKIEEQQVKTKTIHKTLEPYWNETFVFNVSGLNYVTPVKFICMDWDKTSKDDYMGEFTVLLGDLLSSDVKENTVALTSTTGEHVSGNVTFSSQLSRKQSDFQIQMNLAGITAPKQ